MRADVRMRVRSWGDVTIPLSIVLCQSYDAGYIYEVGLAMDFVALQPRELNIDVFQPKPFQHLGINSSNKRWDLGSPSKHPLKICHRKDFISSIPLHSYRGSADREHLGDHALNYNTMPKHIYK